MTQLRKMARFGVQTLISFAVNFGLLISLTELGGLPPEWAYAISLLCVMCVNYLVCRFYVFDARNTDALQSGSIFVASTLVFRLLEYVAYWVALRTTNLAYWLLFFPV